MEHVVFVFLLLFYHRSFAKRTLSYFAFKMPSAANNELIFIIHELKLTISKIKFIWEFSSFGLENVVNLKLVADRVVVFLPPSFCTFEKVVKTFSIFIISSGVKVQTIKIHVHIQWVRFFNYRLLIRALTMNHARFWVRQYFSYTIYINMRFINNLDYIV